MKKGLILTVLILIIGSIFLNYSTYAHGGYMSHRNHFRGNGWGMGCGMRGMMNPGMMNRGMMMRSDCYNWMQQQGGGNFRNQNPGIDLRYDNYGNLLQPLTKEQAKAIAESYIEGIGNPRLKLGQFIDKGDFFEFSLVTKDDSLVERYAIDKKTAIINSLIDQ